MNGLIGNTPLIKINYKYLDTKKSVYAKLEWYSLTGSIKDRMVSYIIRKAKSSKILKDKQVLVEATSGNTGIALSSIGAYYKHPVVIFMPDFVSKERVMLMESYGALVKLVSREEGGFIKCLELAKDYAKNNNGFLLNQFENKLNSETHYNTTAQEIINSLNNIRGFVSGIGSGGTLMGIGSRLKEENSKTIIAALEPTSAPMLSTGKVDTSHRIEGIGDDFIPEIVDKNVIDKIYLIDDYEAINMSSKIARELGLGVGISSGANLLVSVLLNEDVDGKVVTVFADDQKKYLTTDLMKEVKQDNLISNKIELLSYDII